MIIHRLLHGARAGVRLAMAILIVTLLLGGTDALSSAGNVRDDGTSYVGGTLVITGQSMVPSSFCGISYGQYRAVLIDSGGGPPTMTNVSISAGVDVRPGKHYRVVSQSPCGGNRLFLDIQEK